VARERPALLIATRSVGKLRELRPMIRAAGYEPVTLDDAGIALLSEEESVEAFDTFEENAMAKARYYLARAAARGDRAPGLVLADDSGLEVAALGGEPGVRSKRYSGAPLHDVALDDANNAKLIGALHAMDTTDRRARYVCIAAVASAQGECFARGECPGVILESPRGDGGFGYDPFFFSVELKKSFGEATRDEKERVSHRARAVGAVLERLRFPL
jgi:XTP/dITP diphosphohydrolase